MPLNPNDTLLNGQYRILRLLGRGGFGFVYQAQDTLIHREVAIKELIPALVGDEATLKRFLIEARATLELAHESIVRTYNVFQEGGNYYIVMECMSGGSLEERLREGGSLPVDEAVRIATQVCAGLDHAHRRGIVHCDLKPANILFTSDGARSGIGTAKVADFGIAHVSDQMLSRSWMTPAGFVAGTLPYMSPEQTDGRRDDPRVDVYALGAVLYRMLTGKTYLEFDQRETPRAQAENVHRIYEVHPEPPSAHDRRVPAWLDAVVLKALSKRPEERYGSAAKLQAALEKQGMPAAQPAPMAVERETPAPRRTPGRPTWFWPALGAAGLLLIITAVALGLLFGGGTGPAGTPAHEPTQLAAAQPGATATLAPTHTTTPTPTRRPTDTPMSPTETRTPAYSPPPGTSTPSDTPALPPSATPKPTSTSAPPIRSERIAFMSRRDSNGEIYAMNPDGSGVTRLTNSPAGELRPAWSPDGSRIAFIASANGSLTINIMNADGSGVTRLTDQGLTSQKWYHPLYLAWSPDGQRIAFINSYDKRQEIYVVNADGSGARQLTDDQVDDDRNARGGLAWSPDGRRIAFASNRDGNYEIYVMNADGSGQTRLTNRAGHDYGPAWSPDGTRIAFVREQENNWDIAVMNADGTGMTVLTNHPARDESPTWSPDSKRIAFASYRDGNMEIYVMNANGTGVRRLTNHTAWDDYPAWSP